MRRYVWRIIFACIFLAVVSAPIVLAPNVFWRQTVPLDPDGFRVEMVTRGGVLLAPETAEADEITATVTVTLQPTDMVTPTVVVTATATVTATPTITPTIDNRQFVSRLPFIGVSSYRIPVHGVGVPYERASLLPSLIATTTVTGTVGQIEGNRFFVVDWWLDCARHANKGYLYLPMAWGEWDNRLLQCNDGRPLLVLNEPEHADQANKSPDEAADLWHVALEQWRGEVYCCGVMAQHVGYMRLVVNSYKARYGDFPPTARTHVHVYSLGADGYPVGATAQYDVDRAIGHFDTYLALAAESGLLRSGVIVSEYGVLDNKSKPDDLVLAMMQFEEAFQLRRDVVAGWTWFALNSDNIGPNTFNSSNLVASDGTRTALGNLWRRYVEQ